MRLDLDENYKLFYYSAYFCCYLYVSLHFLVPFMGPTILFQLILSLSTILSTISFQFQQNKWYSNKSKVFTQLLVCNTNLAFESSSSFPQHSCSFCLSIKIGFFFFFLFFFFLQPLCLVILCHANDQNLTTCSQLLGTKLLNVNCGECLKICKGPRHFCFAILWAFDFSFQVAFLYFILFLSITSRHFSILQDIYQYTRHFILLSFKLHCPVVELFFNLFDTTKNYFVPVWIELKETESHIAFSSFFFFFSPVHEQYREKKTLFTHCS